MTISSFIATKRDGGVHSKEDIDWFVSELVAGRIPDYQTSAWLMAAYLAGLNPQETVALTVAMAKSGETLDLAELPHPVIDKHSTGGVGDAVTPLFLPIMAACGMPVVKMSGRGLGFTGGTVDKMESIPGFRTDLSPIELREIADNVGCALGGQTKELAPADKILYALRDATSTVANTSLIAASVMSKKLAAGADIIILDVKAGSGAFMKTVGEASKLAEKLVEVGKGAGKKTRALVTDMSQPLGPAIGNALELRASIRELKNGCKGRLGQLVIELCNTALDMADKPRTAQSAVDSGEALTKMKQWIAAQGGMNVVDDEGQLVIAPLTSTVTATQSGYIRSFATDAIGMAANHLGAGRSVKDSPIDLSVGIEVRKEIGDKVEAGEPIFDIFSSVSVAPEVVSQLIESVSISVSPVLPPPLVVTTLS